MHRLMAAAVTTAAALLLTGVGAPSARADGHVLPCGKHRHELARKLGSTLWEHGGSLYGCVAGYLDDTANNEVDHEGADPSYSPTPPRRLGPWSPSSRVVFDGVEAAWTARKQLKSGQLVDAVYAVDVNVGKPWLRAARPTFDLADRQIAALKLGQNFAAWVTTRGTVVAAAEGGFGDPSEPDAFDLDLVGAGTPGLVSALVPLDRRLLIGKFDAAAAQAGSTLRLRRLSDADMENEECIGSYRWEVTVRPAPNGPRVGGIWRAAYFPSSIYCS